MVALFRIFVGLIQISMKRIIILITAILFATSVFAQEHMTFKGVEINGTPEELIQKLEEVGFSYLRTTEDGLGLLKGRFAGYDAILYFQANVKGNVHTIAATYEDGLDTWAKLLERFNRFEEDLTKKYGEPIMVNKYDGYNEWRAIRDGEGQWSAAWSFEKGGIVLAINIIGHRGVVAIGYTDYKNLEVDRQQAYDDL